MKVEKTRLIRVRIQKEENAALVVAVGNSAAMALEFNEETMQTDKPDSLLHGYGFQNIREVLLKYDAVPAVECRNGWFQFSDFYGYLLSGLGTFFCLLGTKNLL